MYISKHTSGTVNFSTGDASCDDNDDVTDLLNMLSQTYNGSSSSESKLNQHQHIGGVDHGNDMLDFLLKYESDEEENRYSSSPIVTTCLPPTTFKAEHYSLLQNVNSLSRDNNTSHVLINNSNNNTARSINWTVSKIKFSTFF